MKSNRPCAPGSSPVAKLLQAGKLTGGTVLCSTAAAPSAIQAARFGSRPAATSGRITSKLAPLQVYQTAIPAPTPPEGSFDRAAAARGEALFSGSAKCATCHVPPLYTEPGWAMHTAAEIGIDDFQASRSPEVRFYRTTPLKGLFTRLKPGLYHDGRFPDLASVIAHYESVLRLELTDAERADLVEFLKSL